MWLPTNVGLRVAELGRRPTQVPESGGCSGLLKDKTTQEDSDSDAPLLRPVAASVEGETIPASSGAVAAFRRGRHDNELLLHRASSITPVPNFPHPSRRSARLQAMGSRAGHRRGLAVGCAECCRRQCSCSVEFTTRDHRCGVLAQACQCLTRWNWMLSLGSCHRTRSQVPIAESAMRVQILEQVWEVPSTIFDSGRFFG